MPWVLLDVVLVAAALAGLAAVLLSLWHQVRDLGREVGRAAEAVGRAAGDVPPLAPLPDRPAGPRHGR